MVIVFLATGTVLLAASVLVGSDWLIAVTSIATGTGLKRGGPPAGAKSRALRDALVRRMRDHAVPSPA